MPTQARPPLSEPTYPDELGLSPPEFYTTEYDVANPNTLRPDTRVACSDALTVASFAAVSRLISSDGRPIPLAGIVLRSQHGISDHNRVLQQFITRLRRPEKVELLEIFPTRSVSETGRQQSRSKQLVAFARRYAAALAAGRMPVVVVRDMPAKDKSGKTDFATDPSIAAFFAGMVAAALRPDGILICSNDTFGDSRYIESSTEIDGLALAASQGRTALEMRRLHAYGEAPGWRHPLTQLNHFSDRVCRFHIEAKAIYDKTGGWPRYWIEPQTGGTRAATANGFVKPHAVMIGGYPSQAPSTAWVDNMQRLLRPGESGDPAHQLDLFRRWLVVHGAALTRGDADIIAAPERTESTPAHTATEAPSQQRIA